VRKVADETVGRNDPCPCGSGKKYKHCHGASGAAAQPTGKAASGAKTGTPTKQRK
jgi:hypothetical protein